jgi:hypothetical protein
MRILFCCYCSMVGGTVAPRVLRGTAVCPSEETCCYFFIGLSHGCSILCNALQGNSCIRQIVHKFCNLNI